MVWRSVKSTQSDREGIPVAKHILNVVDQRLFAYAVMGGIDYCDMRFDET
jgi:hypothetical protein